ncbi:MAG: CPBP family intramembrane metalloprotease [Thermoguttaceae bacterium]|nr:CPBP family intramembrane metalloprotease [Thermoguttaceae bacterium]
MQSKSPLKLAISFLAPFVVYMICTSFEPEPSSGQYPYFYGVKLLLTAIAIAFCFPVWKSYLKAPSFYGVLAGIVGAAVWIGLCQIQKQSIPDFLPGMGLEQFFPSARPGSEYHWGVERNENGSVSISSIFPLFLVRLFGLAIIVPFIEEFFLRGFVLRYFWSEPKKEDKEQSEPTPWYDVPIGALCPMVWAITIVYPLLTHPEALAGVVWFCGITLLAWKTRSLSDCICAHAITNLALGIWVLYSGQWGLL